MLSLYRILALISIAALGAGATHLARYGRRRGPVAPALHTWESEGGAVPVGSTQTAAQVAPRALTSEEVRTAHPPGETPGQQYH